ncbi:hypothetical protein NGRA_2173 [Nosema granulosis]|uniref:Uncharacterized protein n=1 Tax=Nosema granulosis TaxID=83296 RepID=A0A9P6KYE7_9MICR|nr:hypothetical protein NGRA_2173 [Nosema granulosis]
MEQKQLFILVGVTGIVVVLGIVGLIIYVIKYYSKKEVLSSSSASSNNEKKNLKGKGESISGDKYKQRKRKQRNREKENLESETENPQPNINREKNGSKHERSSTKKSSQQPPQHLQQQSPQQVQQQPPQQVQQQQSKQIQQLSPQKETVEQKKKSLEIFNKNKGEFIKQAFDLELDEIKNAKGSVPAVKLPFTTKNSNTGNVIPVIKHGKDSLFEVFRLMDDPNFIVAANTAANGIYIGGGFSENEVNRKNGNGSQEEAFMCVFKKLFTSLCFFAETNDKGLIKRGDKNRFLYQPMILEKNVLFSDNLFSRVPLSTQTDTLYLTNPSYDYFFDYLVQRVANETKKFDTFTSKNSIKIYSICGYDRRNKPVSQVNYNQIKLNTKLQISTMLEHASNQGVNAVVITIPGTGVFSWKTNQENPDQLMLDAVEKGAVSAVKNFGKHFKEIVICGHRDPKNSIFKTSLKQNSEKWYIRLWKLFFK